MLQFSGSSKLSTFRHICTPCCWANTEQANKGLQRAIILIVSRKMLQIKNILQESLIIVFCSKKIQIFAIHKYEIRLIVFTLSKSNPAQASIHLNFSQIKSMYNKTPTVSQTGVDPNKRLQCSVDCIFQQKCSVCKFFQLNIDIWKYMTHVLTAAPKFPRAYNVKSSSPLFVDKIPWNLMISFLKTSLLIITDIPIITKSHYAMQLTQHFGENTTRLVLNNLFS